MLSDVEGGADVAALGGGGSTGAQVTGGGQATVAAAGRARLPGPSVFADEAQPTSEQARRKGRRAITAGAPGRVEGSRA
jgi:hypothetical protein